MPHTRLSCAVDHFVASRALINLTCPCLYGVWGEMNCSRRQVPYAQQLRIEIQCGGPTARRRSVTPSWRQWIRSLLTTRTLDIPGFPLRRSGVRAGRAIDRRTNAPPRSLSALPRIAGTALTSTGALHASAVPPTGTRGMSGWTFHVSPDQEPQEAPAPGPCAVPCEFAPRTQHAYVPPSASRPGMSAAAARVRLHCAIAGQIESSVR